MTFKLGVGPMSKELVEIICNYSNNLTYKLMIIASRNQIDADSGYVMRTKELANLLKNKNTTNIMVCRDHCGPYFLDSEKELSLTNAITATKNTIATDIESGFNLIHIDVSRVLNDNGYKVAEELIKFCLDLNPNIEFEFGTEENVGVTDGAVKYQHDVNFAKQFPNMKYVVAQTGSLVLEDYQAGSFNATVVKELVELANSNGIGLKEHNADYLTKSEIQLRNEIGVHAVNIAPQLGVIQTTVLEMLAKRYKLDLEWDSFVNLVLSSNKWSKWTSSKNPNTRVRVAGHYCFLSDEYKNLINSISKYEDFNTVLQNEVYNIFDRYTL